MFYTFNFHKLVYNLDIINFKLTESSFLGKSLKRNLLSNYYYNKMKYLIYKNKKSPTQSSFKKNSYWLLEDITCSNYSEDTLTGWKGEELKSKLRLKFETEKEAIYYATKHMLDFEIEEEVVKNIKEKSYADNFKYKRIRTDI